MMSVCHLCTETKRLKSRSHAFWIKQLSALRFYVSSLMTKFEVDPLKQFAEPATECSPRFERQNVHGHDRYY